MKKTLLLLIALSIGLFAAAQQRDLSKIQLMDKINDQFELVFDEPESIVSLDYESPVRNSTKAGDLLKKDIATTANVYSLLLSRQRKLSYCPELDMVAFAHRAGGPSGYTGNVLRINWSFDYGDTWQYLIVEHPDLWVRYPSVTIYNPEGNTDPNNAFFVFVGPYPDAGGWKGVFYGSVRVDGQHLDLNFLIEDPAATGSFYREGIQAFPNGFAYMGARVGSQNPANPYRGKIRTGWFNADDNKFDWNDPIEIPIDHVADAYWTGADKFTFSDNGSIGYYVAIAQDADTDVNPWGHRQPIVFKSTDYGSTWAKVETAPLHTIGGFQEALWPTLMDTTLFVPQFWAGYIGQQYDHGYTIDADGNLHMLAVAVGAYSTHPDSINYSYTFEPDHLFHMMLPEDGVWVVQYIDDLISLVVEGSPYGADWGHRLQMARSLDGEKVFAAWIDTDFEGFDQNELPDLFIWGKDVTTLLYTDVVNVTQFTAYWLDNFWMYLTDIVKTDGMDYHIPVTTSVPGGSDLDPLMNQLFTGVKFTEGDFYRVGVEKPGKVFANNITVSQNYPNPVNGTTMFSIDLNRRSNVTVEVFNIMGQSVQNHNMGNLNAGLHLMELDMTATAPGLYFYTVKTGDQVVTRKMVVR